MNQLLPSWQEAKRTVRRLLRAPAFSAAAVLTIAAATVPSVLCRLTERAILPSLPFERPEELVSIWKRADFGRVAGSYPMLSLLRERSQTLDVAVATSVTLVPSDHEERVGLRFEAVTPNFFTVLGAGPILGRVFHEDENETPLGHPVALLSERLWRERFGGRSDIVGQKVVLSDVTFTVVGVMPESFLGHLGVTARWAGLRGADGWVPAMMAPAGMQGDSARTAGLLESSHWRCFLGVARLRPGRTLSEARAELQVVGREARRMWPTPFDAGGTRDAFMAIPLAEEAVDPRLLRTVLLLKIAGALTLALGGLNLAGMLLARGAERAPVMGLHLVLGASRLALLRQAAVEALMIGAAGGSLAVLLTMGTVRCLGLVEPTLLSRPLGVVLDAGAWRVDESVALASVGLAVLAAVAASLLPVWQSTRLDVSEVLRGSSLPSRGLGSMRLTRSSGLQVALQMACALSLTLPTLLLVRSLDRLLSRDMGFRSAGVVAVQLDLPPSAYPAAAIAPFVGEALRRIREQPAIARASWMSCAPLDCPQLQGVELRLDQAGAPGVTAHVQTVAPGSFLTLGIPMRAGRDFDDGDGAQSPPVALLSEKAARALSGATVGSRVAVMGRSATVVGVLGDVPYGDPAQEMLPTVYAPLTQQPQAVGTLVVRAAPGTTTAAGGDLARSAVASLDPRLQVTASTLESVETAGRSRFRVAGWLLGAAATLALLLAAIGIYGLLAGTVARALPEIGVRMALGASPQLIQWQVLRGAFGLAGIGLAVGTLVGMRCAIYLRDYLYGVRVFDLWALLGLAVTAFAIAVLAALGPARRAARVDPMVALRCE